MGRHADCEIVVEDPNNSISRRQLCISQTPTGGLRLKVIGKAATWVGEERIEQGHEWPLVPGDVLSLGARHPEPGSEAFRLAEAVPASQDPATQTSAVAEPTSESFETVAVWQRDDEALAPRDLGRVQK